MEKECIKQVLSSINGDLNVEFEECEDGIDAVNAILNGNSFDAIFMDNVMFKMDGMEATRCIRALGFSGQIIAVTGNVMKDDVDAFLKAGANYFLEKPLQRASIHEILQRILLRV